MATNLAMSAKFTNITDPNCLDSYATMVETITVDPAISATLEVTELIGLDGNDPVAGGSAYPVYSTRQGGVSGQLQTGAYLAGIMKDQIAIVKFDIGATVAPGDLIAATATRTGAVAAAGQIAIGESLDELDGTLAVLGYCRVRLDRIVAP